MKLKKGIKIIILSAIIIFLSFAPVFADVGSFDRYDSGSDWSSSSSDWGSSSSWSSSSSDWDSSSSWSSRDDDYSYSGGSGDFGFLLGWMLGSKPGIIITLIIVVIMFMMFKKQEGKRCLYYLK